MFLLIIIPVIFALLFAFGVFPFSVEWIPVLLCGEISLAQLIKVIKQKDFLFNVYFYVWVFTIISAFIAPCINLYHNEWGIVFWPQPSNWLPYALKISLMYLTGIILWSIMLKDNGEMSPKNSNRTLKPKWRWIMWGFMFVSLIAQLYVYYRAGGILGYMQYYSDDSDFFEGMGLFFILSESFPYIFLIYIMLNIRKQLKRWQFFLLVFALFFITIFFGGLRGSRSNTVLFMVIAIITLNIFLYKIRLKDAVILLVGFFAFMYIGRLYKDFGVDMIYENDSNTYANFGLTPTELVITGDLSRYSVNAYELFRLEKDPKTDVYSSFQKAYGKTYLWGMLTFVPGGKFLVDKFHLKSRTYYATELFFGNIFNGKSSRILGPIGEWFINFGYYTFFIPYLILGWAFRYFRNLTKRIPKNDLMFLVIPPFLTWLPQLLLADFSNIMFFFVKRVLIIWIVLLLISQKASNVK